jgi:alcohol dehydrogenase (cytochrome c)
VRLVPAAIAASVALACASRLDAQSVDPGRGVFASRCAACHGTGGGGGELGPSILARIPLRTNADLEAVIREGLPGAGMPAFATLSKSESADLVAFLRTLRPSAGTSAQRTSVTLADGGSLPGLVLNQSAGEMQVLGDDRRVHLLREVTSGRYREVTSQTGWTTYNGQVSGNRYSTLTQITAGNVSTLAPQWVFTLPNLSQGQVTPVVADGVTLRAD